MASRCIPPETEVKGFCGLYSPSRRRGVYEPQNPMTEVEGGIIGAVSSHGSYVIYYLLVLW